MTIFLIYMIICVFFGALLGGLNGVAWSIGISLLLIALTFALGDKCLLFILGAKELSEKEKRVTSLVSNYGCLSLYKPIKVYSFHHSDLKVCYVRSLKGQGSLIISDCFLNHNNAVEILNEVMNKVALNSSQVRDVAVMLSYQMMIVGYLLSPISQVMSSLVFYMFYPVIQMKMNVVKSKLDLGSGQLVHVSNKERNHIINKKIVTDIISDYSILNRENNSMMGHSLDIRKARVSLG